MQLTDLPTDIIVLLFPHLDAKDFLSFTSCVPALLPYRQEPSYWRDLTRATFRLPPQPLLEADGAHWQRLYKNLKTQTKVFTWGSNSRGNLGHYNPPRPPTRRFIRPRTVSGWPQEMVSLEKVGIVADVQCGGWSTVLLNSNGQLWSVGVLNGQTDFRTESLRLLKYPPAYPATSSERYEPSTAVQQFSIGRSRALALSDDGRIWEWSDFKTPAQLVKFFTLDTDPARSKNGDGKVTKVVAGWSKSSAYVTGGGIVFWSEEPGSENEDASDGFMVEHYTVPGTAYRRARPDRVTHDSIDASIGEVTEYIFLDDYIVFLTHLNKLFAYPTSLPATSHPTPVELTQFYPRATPCIKSVQGSFINFGVFTTHGAVLIGSKDLLNVAWESHTTLTSQRTSHEPLIPPALQSSSVISLAFGDYHYHALHANGNITSYGTESQACGSLGLGDPSISHLRGVFFPRRNTGDGHLEVPSWGDGRRTVWFEEEKQQWLVDTCQKGATNEASPRALRLTEDVATTKLVGEWFERGGRNWSKGAPGIESEEEEEEEEEQGEEDGVDPYFALKISAAGHSSAALILVNEEKAARVRNKYVVEQPVLPDIPELIDRNVPSGATSPSPEPGSFLQYLNNNFIDGARWMLGLTARDVREEQQRREENILEGEELRRAVREEIRYNSTYIWEQQPFPRLRYPDGSVMPGEVEISEWKGGEPDFGTAPDQ